MFDCIAEKIKFLAKCTFWAGAALSVYAGVVEMALERSDGFLLGLFTMGFGIFYSWAGALLIYGFGQLLNYAEDLRTLSRDVCDTQDQLVEIGRKANRLSAVNAKEVTSSEEEPVQKEQVVISCPNCKQHVYIVKGAHQAMCTSCNKLFRVQ